MLFMPGDGSVHGVNLMPGLGEPVAFSRIADEHGFNPKVFERNEELFGFRDGDIVVVLPMQNERRRVRRRDMFHG